MIKISQALRRKPVELSPIDLIPDFIPIIVYLDDLIILPLLAAFAIKLILKEFMDQYKEEAEGLCRVDLVSIIENIVNDIVRK